MNHTEKLSPDLWRLSIIGELIHRHPDDDRTLALHLFHLADKTWIRPDGTPCKFEAETLRKWLSRFRAGGLKGLDDTRTSLGTRIPESLGNALVSLRNDHPHWTVMLLFKELEIQHLWNGRQPSKATLYRWCKEHGLLRSKKQDLVQARAFEFTTFGALWLSDFLHGPRIMAQGRKRKTYLLAILDDASRFVIAAKFYLAESIETLMTELRAALQRFGCPQKFYTDNGSAYRSQILHQVGHRFNIAMPHTPAYQPKGRGKIERFFRTVRDQFLAKNEAKTLEHLNRCLQEWISTYHQTPHCGIDNQTPLQKRLSITDVCRSLPETANIDALFMQKRLCRVYKDGTFRLQNRVYEAPKVNPGAQTEVFFMPWNLSQVFYSQDRLPAQLLDKHENAHRLENSSIQKETKHE